MMCGITGTPGTGKSQIGTELAHRGYTVIHLTDTIGPYVTGMDEERDTRLIDEERWVEEFVPVNGFVEGHFAHLLPCERIVVLRCRPDILKTRLAPRNYSDNKIRENIEAEALDSCLIETVGQFDPFQILELDTTDLDAAHCAGQIELFINGKIPPGFGSIDWSGFLEVHE